MSATVQDGSDLVLFQVKLVTYKVEDLLGGPVLIFPCLLANISPVKELLVFVHAGDRSGPDQPVV